MNIDFSTILNAISPLEHSLDKIEDIYRQAEWNDDVHNSYAKYIRECNEAKDTLKRASRQLESIMQELRCITSSNVVSDELEQISQECDNIKV